MLNFVFQDVQIPTVLKSLLYYSINIPTVMWGTG